MDKRKVKVAVQRSWEMCLNMAISQADEKILKLAETFDQLVAAVATMSERMQCKQEHNEAVTSTSSS